MTFSLVGAATMILATVFGAAAHPNLSGHGQMLAAPADDVLAACSKMQASAVTWVTLTAEGDIDEEVEDAYPPDTTLITPVFQYNCVPKKTSIVTVFKLDGEEVYSDKESLKATNAKGLYAYPLGTNDDSPLPEGEWTVEFYNSKTLLTEGAVFIGESNGGGATTTTSKVTVGGLVTDKKSKKPIKGATILVLEPGVTVQDFIDGGQKERDVFTAGRTDSKGKFILADQLRRETGYSIIVVAKGYKATAADGFTIGADESDPVVLNITMNK
jgi:hypothetical protein